MVKTIKEKYLLSGSLEKTNEAYAIAKIVGLKLCEYYNKQFKTSYLTLMPCNLYGPNDNFDLQNSHFIPALIRKIIKAKKLKSKTVEIWGTGNPKREVMYVDDLASAIYFIVNKYIIFNPVFRSFCSSFYYIHIPNTFFNFSSNLFVCSVFIYFFKAP